MSSSNPNLNPIPMEILSFIGHLIQGGLGNLGAYLAAHVLLCLIPAFFIAGAMGSLIPKETIARFLGRDTPKWISYPAAALAGSVLAVCSCTILPLFAGIHRKGAGLGPAVTFLFFAPAANILALLYTGSVLGPQLAFARLALSLAFGIGIGLIMALIFRRDDAEHDRETDELFSTRARMKPAALVFLFSLFALLLIGTLKLPILANTLATFTLPVSGADDFQNLLTRLVPFDAARGEEGVSVHGALLIGLLAVLGVAARKGFERILDGANRWTNAALGVVAASLLFATLRITPHAGGVDVAVTSRFVAEGAALVMIARVLKRHLSTEEVGGFLWESWRFIKQVFPLLVGGVFAVGVIRGLINPEWVKAVAGENTVTGNLAGVAFGVFMYFPTLVEVPIAQLFLSLGMHPGPLLAYLMADPELSLQSILVLTALLGRAKTWTYVGFVALFSVASGLTYGAWVNGAGVAVVASAIGAFLAALAFALWRVSRRAKCDARAKGDV